MFELHMQVLYLPTSVMNISCTLSSLKRICMYLYEYRKCMEWFCFLIMHCGLEIMVDNLFFSITFYFEWFVFCVGMCNGFSNIIPNFYLKESEKEFQTNAAVSFKHVMTEKKSAIFKQSYIGLFLLYYYSIIIYSIVIILVQVDRVKRGCYEIATAKICI